MVIRIIDESENRRTDSNQFYKQLEIIYENLFYPIDEKRKGKYWKKPANNAKELVEFATNKNDEDKFIEIYTSINDDVVGTIRTIFLDFDLSKESQLEWELNHTLNTISDSEINSAIEKFKTRQDINDLTDKERTNLLNYLINKEKRKLSELTEEEIQSYFYKKIKDGYLKEPFEDAMKVADYFTEHGIDVTVNWSGSKGLHIRIPLNELTFTDKINNDPKLFTLSLGEAIETSILHKPIKKSTLDYAVLNRNKGLQRLPVTQHSTSKLYSNFIQLNDDYSTAISHLLHVKSNYLPNTIDKKANTKKFMELSIVKEAISTATENKSDDNYPDEHANPHYNFSSDREELKEMIGKVYIAGHRNEIGYRIVHVLRRSGFTQEEVESIFQELHITGSSDYADTIGGSIKYAYSKDIKHLCGMRHLIKGIEELPHFTGKKTVIDYFKSNFGYYDKPTETEVKPFKIKNKEVAVVVYENNTDKWIVFLEIIDGINLELNFNTLQGSFIRKNDDENLITFEFKYKKQLFKIAKDELKTIKAILADEDVEMPKLLDTKLKQYFKNNDDFISSKKELTLEQELIKLFSSYNVNVRKCRQRLGHYFKEKGMLLRKSINTPYLLDKNTNGYDSVDIDNLVIKLDNELFNNQDLVHSNDVKDAIGFVSNRQNPKYNIVKFNNCLYDMVNFKVISANDEPVFTLIEVAHNYNPQAKGEKVQHFLETSLAKPNNESKQDIEELKQGFLEMIGYILTSGNKLNAFFIIAGIGGAGKGVASNLITNIFGSDKVGRLQLQELTPDNRFATAHLENKQVNIVSDSPKKPIEDTGLLKSITGYDDIPVEPKGKDKYTIPKEEVPDMIVVCNNLPKFKDGIEEAIVQRVVIFEFLNRFRGTEEMNPNLLEELLTDPEEMEWLIYNGIEAYKKMITEGNDFKARIDDEKSREILGKFTDPIAHILPRLVKYSDTDISSEDPIITTELNQLIRYVAKCESLPIDVLDTKGHIKAKHLTSEIREEFGLGKEWTTTTKHIPQLKESRTIFPNLYKTEEYDVWLEKMNKDKKEKVK
ncbi:MAG: DUF5906 domain-containing protein [Methanobrevibacter sp.]|nr:DUF5906 domain-containing protein [Methanobrevibacter sp.]